MSDRQEDFGNVHVAPLRDGGVSIAAPGQRFLLRSLGVALLMLTLGGCGHTALTRTIFDAVPGFRNNADSIKLNPNLRYLRVTARGRVALMVLGYVEKHPQGPIEVWYSSEAEVISLQKGRIVATAGLETDWHAVKNFSLPDWKDMVGGPAVVYRRERDQMPGYRFGIQESVTLYPIAPPSNAKLVGIPATALRWYEEAVIGQPDGLPSARFAAQLNDSAPRIVYGEQCLSPTLCLAWQAWPAAQ